MADAICVAAGSCLLANTLLSNEIVGEVEDGTIEGEQTVRCLITLVAKCGIETAKAIQKGQVKKFDSNPGEDACQSRAAILLDMSKRDLREEATSLNQTCGKVIRAINTRENRQSTGKDVPSLVDFFKEVIGGIRVSNDMDFLVHARLLTVLRVTHKTTEEGIAHTKTDMSKLSAIAKKMNHVDAQLRREIVEASQVKHTIQCIDRMHALAMTPLAKLMTTQEHVVRHTHDPKYKPKRFSCHFFEVLTLLDVIDQTSTVVALKLFRKDHKPEPIFFHEGRPIDIPEGDREVVVIDAVALTSNENILAEIEEIGLREGILGQASRSTPFHHTSTLEDIKCPEARKVVKEAREGKVLSTIEIDHMFLSKAKFEVISKK